MVTLVVLFILWVYTFVSFLVVLQLFLVALLTVIAWLKSTFGLVGAATCSFSTKTILSLTHFVELLVYMAAFVALLILLENFVLLSAGVLIL